MTDIVEKTYLLRMSIQDLAKLMAASNANHFKINKKHLDQWITNRSRDYIPAAGEAVRFFMVDQDPAEVIPFAIPTPIPTGEDDEPDPEAA